MKKTLILVFLLVLLSIGNLYAQSWQYARSFGGQNGEPDYPNNQPHNLVTDNNGNSYVYGTYGAGTEFNDSTLTHFIDGTRGGFIAKFSCNGDVEWFKAVSNSEQRDDQASYMIIENENLYLYGSCRVDNFYKTWFLDTLVIGSILILDYPDHCTYPWIPFRNYSYLIKMDLNGNIIDYHLFSLYNDDIAKTDNILNLWNNPANQRAFSIDNEGNYYFFVGSYGDQTSVVFCDNQPVSDTIEPLIPQAPYYMLKFDHEFNLLWYKSIVQDLSNHDLFSVSMDFQDMQVDSENNLYMVGYLKTNDTAIVPQYPVYVDLGNGNQLQTLKNNDGIGFLIKMNSEGDVLWAEQSKQFFVPGRVSWCHFESILLDENSNSIYISGQAVPQRISYPSTGTILGDNDTILNSREYATTRCGFIAKYDTNGNYFWNRSIDATESYVGSLDLFNSQLYCGVRWDYQFQHNEDYYEATAGNVGFALCSWDINGSPTWSLNVPSTCATGVYNLLSYDTRVNSFGEIITTGTYDYGLTFGEHYIYGDGFKMFIAKYGNPCPIITNETSVFCYGSEYNGSVLTESGDYQFILESSTPEVDSVVNLHATVYPQLTTGINDSTFCKDETYVLEANSGYLTYSWSTGSESNEQELTYSLTGTENVYVTLTDDNCTGIDTIVITIEVCGFAESQVANSLNLYPVPANSHITVQLSDNQKIEAYSVFNLQGKLIKSENISFESRFTISTQELPAGQYLIYVKTEEGVYTGGFVKE